MNVARCANWVIGISLGLGFLVVLNQLQIPYYLFYPRTARTVLISASYDYYLFWISTVIAPLTIVQHRKRLSSAASIGMVAVWVAAFVLALLDWPDVATVLYALAVCAATLALYKSEMRRGTLRGFFR